MIAWFIAGLAALDLGIKSEIERQEEDTFPRDLPCAGGRIRLHKSHNPGFPFGFLKEHPMVVRELPLMVVSGAAGALAVYMTRKGSLLQKLGLSLVIGGAVSNLYDRIRRGYVVDYFTIQWKRLKDVIFNLGDMFVFLGSLLFLIGEAASWILEEKNGKTASRIRQEKKPGR